MAHYAANPLAARSSYAVALVAKQVGAGLARATAGTRRRVFSATASASSDATQAMPLLTPYDMGPFNLSMRIVYPPLTRSRATFSIPQPNAEIYYKQRAHGGLMITEGTIVSPDGFGYPNTPGIFTPEQIEAWKPIAQTVKSTGTTFFMQIWHVGRCSHPDYMPDGVSPPIAPSAVELSQAIDIYTPKGPQKPVMPRAMTKEDIARIVDAFRQGARNAIEAGFDGVEIHGANGYLIDQFIKANTNQRTDEYGGSPANRARFAVEIVKACVAEIGAERVGLRLSPFTDFMEVQDSDPFPTNLEIVNQLNDIKGLAYLHFVEPRISGVVERDVGADQTLEPFRKAWNGTFIVAGGYKRDDGNDAISSGHADLVAYGRHFISNPDLPRRFELNAPLNPYDRSTFYVDEQVKGYIDYPFLEEAKASA